MSHRWRKLWVVPLSYFVLVFAVVAISSRLHAAPPSPSPPQSVTPTAPTTANPRFGDLSQDEFTASIRSTVRDQICPRGQQAWVMEPKGLEIFDKAEPPGHHQEGRPQLDYGAAICLCEDGKGNSQRYGSDSFGEDKRRLYTKFSTRGQAGCNDPDGWILATPPDKDAWVEYKRNRGLDWGRTYAYNPPNEWIDDDMYDRWDPDLSDEQRTERQRAARDWTRIRRENNACIEDAVKGYVQSKTVGFLVDDPDDAQLVDLALTIALEERPENATEACKETLIFAAGQLGGLTGSEAASAAASAVMCIHLNQDGGDKICKELF